MHDMGRCVMGGVCVGSSDVVMVTLLVSMPVLHMHGVYIHWVHTIPCTKCMLHFIHTHPCAMYIGTLYTKHHHHHTPSTAVARLKSKQSMWDELLQRVCDENAYTRARVLQVIAQLAERERIPLGMMTSIVDIAAGVFVCVYGRWMGVCMGVDGCRFQQQQQEQQQQD